ncbi:hypothetical protein GOP47_0021454 [Adiantum capillus-veneris]|uniref:GPI transamidase component PIG-S n=1 Tax=Adiantum capillus-veneris TaxID=13818 RepID=A0A9D4U8D9_ADICA|nr:hypothetical protein GOP47_0021454 [Adiantum capillus-veneris]
MFLKERSNDWNETSVVEDLEEAKIRISKAIHTVIEGKDFLYGGCGKSYIVMVSLDAGEKCARVGVPPGFPVWPCGLLRSKLSYLIQKDDSNAVDEFLFNFSRESYIDPPGGLSSNFSESGVYTVLSIKDLGHSELGLMKDNARITSRAVIGKYRHSWFLTCRENTFITHEEISLMSNIVVKFFMNGGIDFNSNEISMEERGETLPLAADGKAILSFSLLNAEPRDWLFDWNFKDLELRFLEPVLQALQPIADLKVESQVLYYTPSTAQSTWEPTLKKNVVSFDRLPFFVNANEWHLDTSSAAAGRSKVLHFAIYIPPAAECPLHLKRQDGSLSETNGFTSPGWGGVVILNPESCNKNLDGSIQHLSLDDMEPVMNVILAQTRALFGLVAASSVYNEEEDIFCIPASNTAFSDWELDILLRRRASADVASFASTLRSLSHLVQSLPNMVIKEEIGDQVRSSLSAAADAEHNASSGLYHAAAEAARKARSWAEEAFFQPSIMSLLYLPLEHHFAIYTPFFVPVLLHIVLAAFKEFKKYHKAHRNLWSSSSNTSPSAGK